MNTTWQQLEYLATAIKQLYPYGALATKHTWKQDFGFIYEKKIWTVQGWIIDVDDEETTWGRHRIIISPVIYESPDFIIEYTNMPGKIDLIGPMPNNLKEAKKLVKPFLDTYTATLNEREKDRKEGEEFFRQLGII